MRAAVRAHGDGTQAQRKQRLCLGREDLRSAVLGNLLQLALGLGLGGEQGLTGWAQASGRGGTV